MQWHIRGGKANVSNAIAYITQLLQERPELAFPGSLQNVLKGSLENQLATDF